MGNCRGRGKLYKFCAVMLALLILAHSVFFPVRARATGTLVAIAGATVVASWLMACGIYPYISEDGQTFGEWGAGQLRDLWNSYIDSFADGQTPSGGTKETFDKISGFVTGKTIAIAKGFWSELRAFANWVISEFSVANNQMGLQLGEYVDGVLKVPQMSFPASGSSSYTDFVNHAVSVGTVKAYNNGVTHDFLIVSDKANVFAVSIDRESNGRAVYFFSKEPFQVQFSQPGYGSSIEYSPSRYGSNNTSYMVDGVVYALSSLDNTSNGTLNLDKLQFVGTWKGISERAIRWLYGLGNSGISDGNFQGVVADTTTVSVPAELPENTKFGGLTVPDALTPSAPAITDVIEQGVTDRAKPTVIVTDVTIAEGTDVDTETGEITENPVVVTPEDIPINADAYTLPASITTVFPFSIPWDIYRVFQALNAEPQLSEVTIKFPALGTAEEDYDVVISIPPKQWESDIEPFLIWFRRVELVVMCVGITLAMARFIKR